MSRMHFVTVAFSVCPTVLNPAERQRVKRATRRRCRRKTAVDACANNRSLFSLSLSLTHTQSWLQTSTKRIPQRYCSRRYCQYFVINKMFTRQLIFSARIISRARLLRTLHNKPEEANLTSEVEIPVPWGKVTGQLWGSQNKQPILAIHGWQDNAASFNLLAPLIAKNTPVLAIDLPGHGLSSWLPPGSIYTEIVYVLLIKRIMKYFEWEKIKIMAHSLSSMTTYWYAALFPKELQYVIALDYFKFPVLDTHYYAHAFGNAINSLVKLEENMNNQVSYSKVEMKKKWLARLEQIDDAACNTLMTRGVRQKEDGMYVLSRDPRIRIIPIHSIFSKEQMEDFAKLITCPYLILRGTESPYIEKKEYYHSAIQIMQQHNKDVYYEEVPGKHFFHLMLAEPAANAINRFLEKYD